VSHAFPDVNSQIAIIFFCLGLDCCKSHQQKTELWCHCQMERKQKPILGQGFVNNRPLLASGNPAAPLWFPHPPQFSFLHSRRTGAKKYPTSLDLEGPLRLMRVLKIFASDPLTGPKTHWLLALNLEHAQRNPKPSHGMYERGRNYFPQFDTYQKKQDRNILMWTEKPRSSLLSVCQWFPVENGHLSPLIRV
jgi:hypothetical protein